MIFASILISMASMLLFVFGLIVLGSRGIGKKPVEKRRDPAFKWPPLTMIVPVTGKSKHLFISLKSLLAQDYPFYEVIFSLRDPEDPAAPVVRDLVRSHRHAARVFSGNAKTCCQKNHNLLAGIRKADSDTEIFAFCDADHIAPSGWLKALIEPVVQNKAAVATGYHHIAPEDGRIPTLGKAFTVLIIYLAQRIGRFTQPWGGATAMRKALFTALHVEDIWSKNVVDDVSLADRLKKAGIRTVPVPAAALATPLGNETMAGWRDWFARQLLFLKFSFPAIWAGAGAILYLLSFLVLFSEILCVQGILAGTFSTAATSAALFIALLFVSAAALRRVHPSPVPLIPWLAAGHAFVFMAAWCHFTSWFGRKIHWRGITYRVTRNGRVLQIKQDVVPPSARRDEQKSSTLIGIAPE